MVFTTASSRSIVWILITMVLFLCSDPCQCQQQENLQSIMGEYTPYRDDQRSTTIHSEPTAMKNQNLQPTENPPPPRRRQLFILRDILDAIWNLFSFQSKKPKNNTGLPERSISHDGLERYFLEKQPANFQPSSPLVILLHGGTNSMYDLFDKPSIALWLQLSDQNGFLLLAPNGTQRRKLGGGYDTSGTNQVWNDFRYATDVDDVGFLAALVEWARTQRSIDPKRVYVTGASNGGMMTHRMILERPELFAAGAGFIANLVENDPVGVPPSQIPPLLIMNGNQDPLMPWNGGSIANDRGRVRSALATRDYFVSTAKADPSAVVTSTLLDVDPNDGCILRSEYYPPLPLMGPITSSAPIQFYTMDGGGHTIPYMGSVASDTKSFGVVCKDVYGVDLVWKFLSTYTRP